MQLLKIILSTVEEEKKRKEKRNAGF